MAGKMCYAKPKESCVHIPHVKKQKTLIKKREGT
jgi:hypothetical protein